MRVVLFQTRFATGAGITIGSLLSETACAVARDGRFLMNVTVEDATAAPITVVLNWDAELKK